jgi:predicted patatin/cPLA2 family phospholipase
MRGVVSAGALTVLHFLGLKRCFDVTYGSSAGAMNLTYFLSVRPPSIQR